MVQDFLNKVAFILFRYFVVPTALVQNELNCSLISDVFSCVPLSCVTNMYGLWASGLSIDGCPFYEYS